MTCTCLGVPWNINGACPVHGDDWIGPTFTRKSIKEAHMGDTARGTWGSKELGAFVDAERRVRYMKQATDFVATINQRATSDFADEITNHPGFTNAPQEWQAIAQMFYILGYSKGSLTTSLEINKLLEKTIKENHER